MPKQIAAKGASVGPDLKIDDSRFSNFNTDPRFRLPSRKHTHTKIDKRFSRMLKDDDFSNSVSIDRYGRRLTSVGKKRTLKQLYVPAEGSEGELEIEEGPTVENVLRVAEGYDPARGGGFSSSEDEAEEDSDDGARVETMEEDFPDMQAEAAAVQMGEVSTRFAVVNLDWDNIKSTDLMAVFSSFVQPGGRILKISIYPSEFGKERMDHEEMDGPPKDIFAHKEAGNTSEVDSEGDEDEDDEFDDEKIRRDLPTADEGQEFDSAALRQYQLERLRYYYAVVVCSDKMTARNVYESTDGTEYLSSANFFDLRFIPEGTDFDDKPRDECDSVPAGYRPIDFVTDALQHSKVKLTWDMNPEESTRKNAIDRAFTGSRKEIGDNDLRAYLGSDSESDMEAEKVDVDDDTRKLTKKEIARKKMRDALGLPEESVKNSKSSAPVGNMEITFTAGLTGKEQKNGVFENDPTIALETTAERYQRLEKERKARRKVKARAKRLGLGIDTANEDPEKDANTNEDLGFDDPFFAMSEVVEAKPPQSRGRDNPTNKRVARNSERESTESERATLKHLMKINDTQDPTSNIDHFDINEIARQEKAARKKGKKGAKESKRGNLQEGFVMDVQDPRFGKVFESHEFAIDPSNPKFKDTKGMKRLLEEGRRKRKLESENGIEVMDVKDKKQKVEEGKLAVGEELSSLVSKLRQSAST